MNLPRIAKLLEEDNQLIINQTVLDKAQEKGQIIYGARAINRQLPDYLRKQTSDYDILTKKPKKSAKELVEELNRRVGRKEFEVYPAQHKGTFKIKDSKGNTIVDYTQLKRNVRAVSSFGNKFYNIKSIKRNISKSLRNPKNEFRRAKDESSLMRISEMESKFKLIGGI